MSDGHISFGPSGEIVTNDSGGNTGVGSGSGRADDSSDTTGSGGNTITFTDPESATGNVGNSQPGDGQPRRKRGRPKGSGGQAQAKSDIGVQGIAGLLMIIHSAVSVMVPEMELDEKEADTLARASTNLMRQYDIKQSEKAIAWTGFIGALATIYGPRAFAVRTRVIEERKTKRHPINPNGRAGMHSIGRELQ